MEASRPQAKHSLALLAAHCHRAVLRQLLVELGANLA